MDDYIAMQLDFKELMDNEVVLFRKVNALTNIELKKIEYTYLKSGTNTTPLNLWSRGLIG